MGDIKITYRYFYTDMFSNRPILNGYGEQLTEIRHKIVSSGKEYDEVMNTILHNRRKYKLLNVIHTENKEVYDCI